jgi:hypothetical protein
MCIICGSLKNEESALGGSEALRLQEQIVNVATPERLRRSRASMLAGDGALHGEYRPSAS